LPPDERAVGTEFVYCVKPRFHRLRTHDFHSLSQNVFFKHFNKIYP